MTHTRNDTPPDRLSTDPRSPHHHPEVLARGIGIRFNGQERTNVEEYCIIEGWVRVAAGRALDLRGQPMSIKVKGTVETYYLTPAQYTEDDEVAGALLDYLLPKH